MPHSLMPVAPQAFSRAVVWGQLSTKQPSSSSEGQTFLEEIRHACALQEPLQSQLFSPVTCGRWWVQVLMVFPEGQGMCSPPSRVEVSLFSLYSFFFFTPTLAFLAKEHEELRVYSPLGPSLLVPIGDTWFESSFCSSFCCWYVNHSLIQCEDLF